jgi:hypothetical protein
MSLARLKRLQRLESRRPAERPWPDPVAAAASLSWLLTCFAAVAAGRACLIPRFGPMPAPSPAKAAALKQLDGISKRLAREGRG